jgi:hypothetical protein
MKIAIIIIIIIIIIALAIYFLIRFIDPEICMSTEKFAIKYLKLNYKPIKKENCEKCNSKNLLGIITSSSCTLEPMQITIIKCNNCFHKYKSYSDNIKYKKNEKITKYKQKLLK